MRGATGGRWATIVHRRIEIERKEKWHETPKQFLLHHENGVYSCARTINNKIYDWNDHLDRMVFGLYKMQDSTITDSFKETQQYKDSYSRTGNIFIDNIRIGMKSFRKTFPGEEEMRIYSLLENSGPLHNIREELLLNSCWIYIEPLPVLHNREIATVVRKHQRESPEIKSLDWMRTKSELEKALGSDMEECLLAGGLEYDEIYEGLSSNFYVVQNEALHLAPEGTILKGTIMKLVLEACEKLDIPVIREVPSLKNVDQWQGCFISSTTRLALPIHKIYFPDHPTIPEKTFFSDCKQVLAIQSYVAKTLENRSFPVFSDDE